MGCDYKITLRTGEELSFPSILLTDRSEFNFDNLRQSLHILDRNELDNLFNTISNSKNLPLSAKNINLNNVIKTSSLNNILNLNSKNFFKNEVNTELYQTSKSLIQLLKNSGEDINSHNLIYTDTYDLFDTNYGNVYDFETNNFIINTNSKNDINFIPLNKALIDMYIMKYSSNIQNLIETEFGDVSVFLENLPLLYQKGKISKNLINSIKFDLNISDDVFDYIYSNLGKVSKSTQVYEGKAVDDFKLFAQTVYNKFKDITETKELRELYYKSSEYVEKYPSLKTGDLIKTKIGLKQGRFGVYLDEYERNIDGVAIKFYVVLLIDSDGKSYDWKTISEQDLKFTNPVNKLESFVIRKKHNDLNIDNLDLSIVTNRVNTITNGLNVKISNDKKLNSSLIKILKPGDKLKLIYQTDGVKNSTREVVAVQNNKIYLKSIVGKKANVTEHFINDLNITGVTLDLDNHQNIMNFDSDEYLKELQTNGEAFDYLVVNELNKESVLVSLNPGDVVYTKENNVIIPHFYLSDSNLVVDKTLDGDELIFGVSTIKIDEIVGVVYNVADKRKNLELYNEFNDSVYDVFNKGIFNNLLDNKSKLSTYDVSNPSKKSETIKNNISEGDFVEIDNEIFVVMDNKDGNLKLFGNDTLQEINSKHVSKIAKLTPDLSPFTGKILQLNTPFISNDVGIEEIFDDTIYNSEDLNPQGKVWINYVVDKTSTKPIVWEDGEVYHAYFIKKNQFNPEIHKDLSADYASKNLKGKVSLVAYEKDGALMTDLRGTTEHNVKNIDTTTLYDMITAGSYIKFKNSDKIVRIEEKTNEGVLIEYSFKNTDGKVHITQEFVPKSKFESNDPKYSNNIARVYIPNIQTATLDSFKNYKETLKKKVKEEITDKDRIEILNEISTHLSDNFGIPVIIKSTADLKEDESLATLENIDTSKGFLLNGKIYVNSTNATLDTPIHESLHLIIGTLKVLNPELYEQVLINLKKDKKAVTELKKLYPSLTNYELLEELFVTTLSQHIANKIDMQRFNDVGFLEAINESIQEVLQLENTTDTQTLLNSSIAQLINEFGSKYINDPQSMYDVNASNLSNKITNVKSELIEAKQLKEKCK